MESENIKSPEIVKYFVKDMRDAFASDNQYPLVAILVAYAYIDGPNNNLQVSTNLDCVTEHDDWNKFACQSLGNRIDTILAAKIQEIELQNHPKDMAVLDELFNKNTKEGTNEDKNDSNV